MRLTVKELRELLENFHDDEILIKYNGEYNCYEPLINAWRKKTGIIQLEFSATEEVVL